MNKKIDGSITVILILIMSFLGLTIGLLLNLNKHNILRLKNKSEYIQAKYIVKGYRDVIVEQILHNEDNSYILPEKLFNDLEYELNYNTVSNRFDLDTRNLYPIEVIQINVTGEYCDFNYKSEALISTFNKMLFRKSGIITKNQLKLDKEFEMIDKLEKEINEYTSMSNIKDLSGLSIERENSYRNILSLIPITLDTENEDIEIEKLSAINDFKVSGYCSFGNNNVKTDVKIYGIIYNEGTIELQSDLIVDGILVVNNGEFVTNGNNIYVNGLLINLDEKNTENIIINSGYNHIENKIKRVPWTKDYRLIYKSNDPDL